jgi:hypothetical protein
MEGNTSNGKLIWNFLWRASFYGAYLGAGFGALYGGALGTLFVPLIGTAFGFFFGLLSGAVVGLPLGALDGLLLFALTTGHRTAARMSPRRYRRSAAIVFVAGGLLALMAAWGLHGFPDPGSFAVIRAMKLSMKLFISSKYIGAVSNDFFNLTIWALAPMLVALFASWLTGRAVAAWYEDHAPVQPGTSGQRVI